MSRREHGSETVTQDVEHWRVHEGPVSPPEGGLAGLARRHRVVNQGLPASDVLSSLARRAVACRSADRGRV
jgi:hypothetical protein